MEMAWDPIFKPNKMENVLKVWSSKGLQWALWRPWLTD